MVIYRSSDSLSRCDPSLYSNMYDVRKRPDLKQEIIVPTQPKDTIEISHDKLKQEALSRLRHTSKYSVAQNSFMRVGKYLFLAIAFPPYLMVYGLPKWIIVEVLPTIFSMGVWMWKKVQNPIQKYMIEVGNQKIAQMVQWTQKMKKALMKPIIYIVLEFRQAIHRMREYIVRTIRPRLEKMKVALKAPRLKFTEKVKSFKNRLVEVKDKWSEKINDHMQQGIQWLREMTPQLFWGQIQRLKQQSLTWHAQWKTRFHAPEQWAQRVTHWVEDTFNRGGQRCKEAFAPLFNFYRQQLQPRWQKLQSRCQAKWQQGRNFFQQRHQRALAFLYSQQEKLKHLSSNQFLSYLTSHPWVSKLPLQLQKKLRGWLSHSIMQAICDKGIKIYSVIAHLILQIAILVLKMLSDASQGMGKIYRSIRESVKLGVQSVFSALNFAQKSIRKSAFYALYYFLLFSMITFILFVWGMHSVGDYMNSLISRFSFKKNWS